MSGSGSRVLPRTVMAAVAFTLALAVALAASTALHSNPESAAVREPASAKPPITTEKPPASTVVPRPEPERATLPNLQAERPKPEKAQPPEPRPSPETETAETRPPEKPKPRVARKQVERAAPEVKPEPESGPEPRAEPDTGPRPEPEAQSIQRLPSETPKTASDDRKAAAGPRKKEKPRPAKNGPSRPARGVTMALTIESLGLRNQPIEATSSQRALDEGLIRLPQTSVPWDRGKSRNVYVVGHRLGWPGTGSWKIFYDLDELRRGDELVLTGRGKTYRYRVSERLVVSPYDVWVTDRVKGRDLLTLQTCTGANFGKRLIIRADRV